MNAKREAWPKCCLLAVTGANSDFAQASIDAPGFFSCMASKLANQPELLFFAFYFQPARRPAGLYGLADLALRGAPRFGMPGFRPLMRTKNVEM